MEERRPDAASGDICVIVPTIREYECLREYVANARSTGSTTSRLHFVLVTEDFCDVDEMQSMLDDLGVSGKVFDGSRREEWYEANEVAEYGHVVPAASHAETSFGLLYMWADESFEYGLFIDDDTLPDDDEDYFGRHMENLGFEGAIERVSSDKQWVNVLYQNADEHGLYPRGYPYSAMNETVETGTVEVESGEVVASQGWTNVPDLDAVRILMDGDLEGRRRRGRPPTTSGATSSPPATTTTVCSMNLAFRREVIPAFYQLPMDDNEWEVGRFDDIWSGVFLKRACDVLGKRIYNGGPLCEHNKAARSTFDDLHNEVAGLELNEHLWELIDDAGADADDYVAVYDAMADRLTDSEFDEYRNGAFFTHVGEHMRDWLDCLDALRRTPAVADD